MAVTGPSSTDIEEREILETYERQGDIPFDDEFLTALDTAGFDLTEQDPPLMQFVDLESLARLQWDNEYLCVQTRVWGHPVCITSDQIMIYSAE